MNSLLILIIICSSLTSAKLVKDYDPLLAARALLYAQAAYCPDEVKKWTCQYCLELPQSMHLQTPVPVTRSAPHGVKVFVGLAKDQTLVISFRGTNNTANWWANLKFAQDTFYKSEYVHRGFNQAYHGLSSKLNSFTKPYIFNSDIKRILITGHSLGGAVATIYIAHLTFAASKSQLSKEHFMCRADSQVYIFTFGQPRVGNDAFADNYLARIKNIPAQVGFWRIVNGRDPVPALPKKLAHIFWKYHHVYREVYYPPKLPSKEPKYKLCGRGGEDRHCSLSLYKRASITRHDIDNYRSRLFKSEVAQLKQEVSKGAELNCPTSINSTLLKTLIEIADQKDTYQVNNRHEERQQLDKQTAAVWLYADLEPSSTTEEKDFFDMITEAVFNLFN